MLGVPARAFLVVLVVGCGRLPRPPAFPKGYENFKSAGKIVLPGVKQDLPRGAQLYPGDIVTLRKVAQQTTETEGLVVDDRGNLHVPLAGDVRVTAMPISNAEKAVEQSLRQYDRFSRVHLSVEKAEGQVATVIGAVAEPGRVAVTPGMRLADLLAAVGGPVAETVNGEYLPLADLDAARLVRGTRTMPVSIPKALRGDPRHNVRIVPADQLFVPPRLGQRIAVIGELNAPVPVSYHPGIRLTEALSVAGSLNVDGHRGDIRVIRGPSNEPTVYVADLNRIYNGKDPDVVLAPGDVIYVTDHWLADVGEVLERLSPILSVGLTVGIAIGLSQQQ